MKQDKASALGDAYATQKAIQWLVLFGLACAMAFICSFSIEAFAVTDDFKTVYNQAKQGDPDSQFRLGYMYLHGIDVTQNSQAAKKWYTLAAEHGHHNAQNNLGVMYFKGQGIPKNYPKAAYWYEKAAENGVSEAASSLAGMYLTGEGVAADGWKAIEWYGLPAYRGEWRAQYDIGLIYKKGIAGVPVDLARAYAWYLVASIKGGSQIERRAEELANQMTPEDVAEGERLSAEIWSKVDAPLRYPLEWFDLLFGPYQY